MIRIDTIWLATTPMDMRAGMDSALARVVSVFGCAYPHTAYLFANQCGNRIKVLVHDGFGIWLAARRLHQGKFVWAALGSANCTLLNASSSMRWCWVCRGHASAVPGQLSWSESCKKNSWQVNTGMH
jgi:transposase